MLDIQCTQSGNVGLAGSGPVALKIDESLRFSMPLLQAGCTDMLPPRDEIRRMGKITFCTASSSSWDSWNEQEPREDTFKHLLPSHLVPLDLAQEVCVMS